jgi:hypothetical protein
MRQSTIIATTALAALIALPMSAPARAQCTFGCNRYDQGQCVEYRQCSPGTSTPSAPSASYGAIAYGRTSGSWGTSYQWGNQAKAENEAMRNCAQHGKDCEVMVWFERKCGAVAADGTTAYWALGNSEGQARADAQDQCVKGGGKACKVQVYQCSK